MVVDGLCGTGGEIVEDRVVSCLSPFQRLSANQAEPHGRDRGRHA